MKIEKFNKFNKIEMNISESVISEINIIDNIQQEYKDIIDDILDMIDNTLKDIDKDYSLSDFKDFIDDYIIDGLDASNINEFIDDSDISNFYHKHHTTIDEFLLDDGYLDKTPKENQSYGLYDYLINGTKQCVLKMIEKIKDNL